MCQIRMESNEDQVNGATLGRQRHALIQAAANQPVKDDVVTHSADHDARVSPGPHGAASRRVDAALVRGSVFD